MNQWKQVALTKILFLGFLGLIISGCHTAYSGNTTGYKSLEPQGQRYAQQQTIQQGALGQQLGTTHSFPNGRPYTFAEYKERYRTVGKTPQGAVRMYFDALYCYIDPARKEEGAKMLRYSLHERQNWERSPAWGTFASRLKDPSYHHIFRSYAQGTSPQNSYQMNPDNYQLMFLSSRQETDFVRVAIKSTGADNPRTVHVKQFEDGLWYVINNHNTYVEVRPPANRIPVNPHDADFD